MVRDRPGRESRKSQNYSKNQNSDKRILNQGNFKIPTLNSKKQKKTEKTPVPPRPI